MSARTPKAKWEGDLRLGFRFSSLSWFALLGLACRRMRPPQSAAIDHHWLGRWGHDNTLARNVALGVRRTWPFPTIQGLAMPRTGNLCFPRRVFQQH